MWKETTINVGTLVEKDKVKVAFKYEGKCVPYDLVMQPSCGCTDVKWNSQTSEINAVLRAGNIPRHLEQNSIAIRKSIKVTYLCDGTQYIDRLYITGTLVKKV